MRILRRRRDPSQAADTRREDGSGKAPFAWRPLLLLLVEGVRRALRRHYDQLHRGPRRADKELARDLLVEPVEIDLGEDDARRRLALESINRFEQDITLAILRVAEQIV